VGDQVYIDFARQLYHSYRKTEDEIASALIQSFKLSFEKAKSIARRVVKGDVEEAYYPVGDPRAVEWW
jgi:hypothetical protein